MPRSTAPRSEARLHAPKHDSMPRSAAAFDLVLNSDNARFSSASAPNSTHSARLRSKLHAAGEHRTPRNLGGCTPSHPRLCQASNHCENRYISRKTLTSAVIGHVCTFGSDDPRVFSDFNPLLHRPHLSTSMSASVSQLPNGKHSPLSHRNGTYYWQGE